jgi:hypothetical protein
VDSTHSRTGGKRQPRGGRGLAVALVLLATLIVAGVGWASLTGRLASLQYANVPIVHPYPRAGLYVNPYTGDPRDLVSSSEAAKVKADFLHESQQQLDAFARGDRSILPQTATGRFLSKLDESLMSNNASGILEQEQDHIDAVVIGRLADPNAPSTINWCVEERGSGQTNFVQKSTGSTTRKLSFHFRSRYWMVRVGDRYVMADAMISSVPDSAQ